MRRWRTVHCLLLLAVCCSARSQATAQIRSADNSSSSNSAMPEPIAWRQAAFSIPFKVATDAAAPAADVRLYVSKNMGGNWDLAQKVGPQEHSFLFRAPSDGEYWFQIRTADRQGRVTPEVGGPPELRVIVDTLPPRLDLTATRGASGEVKATWQAVDPLLDDDSLKIEYQNTSGQWRVVAVDRPRSGVDRSTTTGTLTWFPDDAPTGTVLVRAQISDRAGNITVAQGKADAALEPISNPNASSSLLDNTAQAATGNLPSLSLGNSSPTNTNGFGSPLHNSNLPFQGNSAQPPLAITAQSNAGATSWPGEQSTNPWSAGNSGSLPYERHPIPSNDNLPQRPGQTDQSFYHPPPSDRLAAGPGWETVNPAIQNQALPRRGNGGKSSEAEAQPMLPPGVRPLMVNSRTFDMDYEVDAVGPSGIAKVELWGTQNGGRTWQSYGVDPDNRSPIRAKVDGEGLYGFRVVVQSGSGLSGQPPASGDRPDIWVQVDLTKPIVELIDARAGEAPDAGMLVIRWQAKDAALAARPITLSFSDKPDGPWSIIAAGLENTGQYSWRPDNRMSGRIYLRIEARDEAGNVGSFITPQPVSLDQSRPGGRIQSVRPIGDSAAISHTFSDTANGARIYQFSR